MDTSKKYVEMCEKAEEIQKWYGDWAVKWDKEHAPFLPPINDMLKYMPTEDNPARLIWLPRQDQLQAMLEHKHLQALFHYLYMITEFWIGLEVESYEQLWLAFVMKENYSKHWDNKKKEWKTY